MTADDALDEVPTTTLSAERCHLGEGPTYDATNGTAWWFDILERRLFEADIASGRVKMHVLAKMASALARIDAKRQLVVTEDGLYIRDLADGRMELFAPLEADNPATRSNDARVHPSGTLWLGTMGRKAEPRAGAIYALHRGQISRLYSDVTIPNAICFSPDGSAGYFGDTATNILSRAAGRGDRLAGRRAKILHPPHRRGRHRWRGGRCGRADLECALGRRLRRCLRPRRNAPALLARSCAAVELPGLCRPRSVAASRHLGVGGHG
jgi:sugar lactone lactonase YvrE